MNIQLEQLWHQQQALDAIMQAFPQRMACSAAPSYANPILMGAGKEEQFIDCKMETGTGKTYVYTRLMYELHKERGLFKFVVVVPSLAIKEGTRNFIEAAYSRMHFASIYTGVRMELNMIRDGDFAQKTNRRKCIPEGLRCMCQANAMSNNIIHCLLVNMHMLTSKGFSSKDFDQSIFDGLCCPKEMLQATRPVIIIDEPHRIAQDNKAYSIIKALEPQIIVRFGATFPLGQGGASAYYRSKPVYDLGAVESFNMDLVKSVNVSFANVSAQSDSKKYKVTKVGRTLILKREGKELEIKQGESLPDEFGGGIEYAGSNKLSNDLELAQGMDLVPESFSMNYQEILLSQALDKHFEAEKENFYRANNAPKVKTLALFFIDSISSYRNADGWLRKTFEKLLKAKLERLINNEDGDYKDFLRATLCNIAAAHAGYFAQDNGNAAIEKEVDDILRNKATMLQYKDAQGNWIVRRFFFSKWTLREGWDNPNVFTICKLRSSGSQTSKIQEVGRGLRLPVDESGSRLCGQGWRLNYIVGWDEKEFASTLVGEINKDAKLKLDRNKLSDDMLQAICHAKNIETNQLLEKLITKDKIINYDKTYTNNGYDKLLAQYPELSATQLKQGKVTTNSDGKPTIKLRKENWESIKDFWQQVSKRYMLRFERLPKHELAALVDEVLAQDIFSANTITITAQSIEKDAEGNLKLMERSQEVAAPKGMGRMKYGEFIRKLHQRTYLPVALLYSKIHGALQQMVASGMSVDAANQLLCEHSCNKFALLYEQIFIKTFAARYQYDGLDFCADVSVLKGGSFVDELEMGLVGSIAASDIADDKRNLYESTPAYDSELEHEVMKIAPDARVVVFGKLPRMAIKAPTYTGGTTTPDFIYAIEKDGMQKLYLLLETKSADMRDAEKRAVLAQEKFLGMLDGVRWQLISDAKEVAAALSRL
jgi:type III restriction enzyme